MKERGGAASMGGVLVRAAIAPAAARIRSTADKDSDRARCRRWLASADREPAAAALRSTQPRSKQRGAQLLRNATASESKTNPPPALLPTSPKAARTRGRWRAPHN